jgi:hypothetical protein
LKMCFDMMKVLLSVLYFRLFVNIFLLKKEKKRKNCNKAFRQSKT